MASLTRWAAAAGFVAAAGVALTYSGVLNAQQAPPSGTPPAAKGGAAASPAAPQAAPAVTVAKPLQRRVVEWDEYTGRFDAVESVDIRARVSGYLIEVHFRDGQHVDKGALLYTIDPRPFERALEQAKAELAQAQTKAENAVLDVERGRPLVDRKIMSEKVFDDRANALREAQSQVKVADAKVKTAELDLFFTKITSPLSGRISRSSMSTGSWVSAGAASNAALLTTIVSEDPIHLYFDISENNWIKYRRMIESGQKEGAAQQGSMVEIALPDEKGFPHKGRVDFVDNRLDQATGTMRTRALVDNKAGTFSPGMFARVRVQGSPEYEALMLPEEAVGIDQTNRFVFAVNAEGVVARKPIALGPMVEGLRVIRSGLAADDMVIIKGLQRARPGNKVSPKQEQIRVSDAGPQGSTTARP
ncbi:MAG: efflux RND transporter periplasmic adaptor subunit [Hyphomicrobiales bacterium]|nr:efflux RND transporter periplasmic adaptor subunit [Hyphomicrobiales bacterium]